MPIGNSYKQNEACKPFRLSLLGDEISLNIKDSQSRKE
jgi:hypothetical protein